MILYEVQFLIALITTILIETGVLYFIIRYVFKTKSYIISDRVIVFLGVFCSFATLPYLWFIMPVVFNSYYQLLFFGEILTILIESVIYSFILNLGYLKSLIISIVCNVLSLLGGEIIKSWF